MSVFVWSRHLNTGSVVARFAADISGFMNGIREMVSASSGFASHIGSIASTVGGGFLSMGRSVLGAVEGVGRFAFFAKYAGEAAVGFASALLGQNANMEQSRVAFTGLLGSGQAADAMLRKLWSFAASTPFEFPQLVQSSQQLLGMGFAARDVIPVLTAVGDAAAGVGRGKEGIDHITLALGQMQARGKVTGQDMMQLTEAGIPAWKILADSMHLSVAQVEQLSQQGKLGADSVTALWHGMEKMYGGQMAGQAQTFNGLLSTLKDNAMSALMTFSGPIFTMAKSGLSQLTTLAGSPAFSAFAKTLGQDVAQGLASIVNFIKQAVQWFGQFGPQVDQVKTAFGNLGSALSPVVNDFQRSGTASTILRGALDGLKFVIVAVANGISGLANGLSAAINWIRAGGPEVTTLKNALQQAGAFLRDTFLPVWQQLVTTFQSQIIPAWNQFIAAIGPALPALKLIGTILLGTVVVALVLFAKTLAATMTGAIIIIGLVVSAVLLIGNGFLRTLAMATQVFNWIKQAAIDTANWIKNAFNAAINWLSGAWGTIRRTAEAVWSGLKADVQAVVDWLKGAWKSCVDAVVAAFAWLYNHNYYFKQLVDTIRNVVQSGIDWLTNAWNTAVSWLGNKWNELKGLAQRAWDGVKSVFSAVWGWISGILNGLWSSISGWWTGTVMPQMHSHATSAWDGVRSVFASAWSNYIAGPLGGLANSIGGFFNDLAGKMVQYGRNLIQGVVDGINGMLGSVRGAAESVASTITGILGFHSPPPFGPAKDSDQWMPNMIGMFEQHIRAGAPSIQAAASMLIQPLAGPVSGGGVGVAPLAVASRHGGSSSETNDILRQILRQLGHDRGVTQGQIIDALGDALGNRIRSYRGPR